MLYIALQHHSIVLKLQETGMYPTYILQGVTKSIMRMIGTLLITLIRQYCIEVCASLVVHNIPLQKFPII